MGTTTNLALPQLLDPQSQKTATHNAALARLDVLVQLTIQSRSISAAPGSPAEGQSWYVKPTGSGAWTGHNNALASWQNGAWVFSTLGAGFVAYVVDEDALAAWNGTAWSAGLGARLYQGAWNASTNSPAIPAAGSGNKGFYYIVNVAGTTTIDGISSWANGDWIVSNGTTWEKIPSSTSVASVAGLVGAITGGALKSALGIVAADIGDVGAANGVAGLDGTGKVPTSQLPAAVLGALDYQTTWNASTNSPAIPAAASGNKGWFYKVATAGTTTIDGINDWAVGDWIVSNGATWEKVDNTDQVLSVAGLMGAITAAALKTALAIVAADIADSGATGRALLQAASAATAKSALSLVKADVGLGNVDNTSDVTKFSTAFPAIGQLPFPATQIPSSDPNTLDDYEEGTFTPTLATTGTAPTGVTYSAQSGIYTKIGRAVFYNCRIALSNKGTGATGNAQVAGLPFTCEAVNFYPSIARFALVTHAAGYTQFGASVLSGTSLFTLDEHGSGVAVANVPWSNLVNTSTVTLSGHYTV